MNAHIFRRFCQALTPLLSGARLEKIHALSQSVSQFGFHGREGRFTLIVRAHRQNPFMFMTATRVAVGAPPPMFVMRLRKYLSGQRVTGLFCDWLNRRLWLRFFPTAEVWLCLDLRDGPHLAWEQPEELDPASIIADGGCSLHDPHWPGADELAHAGASAWRDWPVLSPALRRTLALLPPEEQNALLVDLEAGGGDLFLYTADGNDTPELSAWPLPPELAAGRNEHVYDDPLQAVRITGERLVLRGLAEEAARTAAKPHTAEERRLEKLLQKLQAEEHRLADMAALQEPAKALQAALFRYTRDARAEAVDLEVGPDMQRITLDPRLTIRENMAAMFHKSGRGRRGLSMLQTRRESVQQELEAARARAATAAGMAPPHLVHAPDNKKAARARTEGPVPQLPKGVQAFRSSDGLLLLRGKDARGNLAALKLGRPDDLWLHAEGSAGAHVILRRLPGQPVPEETLREAAVLAALKSPYRDAGTALVQCALVRHVHPMRGATPGTVRIDRHEPGLTVRLDPDLEIKLASS